MAGPAADEVDRDARFPFEAFDALKEARALSALVPVEFGGTGATLSEVADAVEILGRHCASTAMIFAMHQIQVACIVRHGRNEFFQGVQRELAESQLLLASATSEVGVGGDVRTSICCVEEDGNEFILSKQAPVISYGEDSDAVLVTARRGPGSPPSDQVIVLCRTEDLCLDQLSGWDTLGFRGTCSLGYSLRARGPRDAIIPDSFGDVSSQTMLPVSHLLWSSVWLGIATGAMQRARKFVQADARSKPGAPSLSALRLSEATALLYQMRATVEAGKARYERLEDDRNALSSIGFALDMNNLKVLTSTQVVELVGKAMGVCGIAAYRHDSPYALGRYLRDAYGAALMVSNDRIHGNNSQLLLAHREQ